MGAKNHKNFQSDPPESGGADRDSTNEKAGFAEEDKQRFAEKQADARQDETPHQTSQGHDEFSVGKDRKH
jgi:hypothetical protein